MRILSGLLDLVIVQTLAGALIVFASFLSASLDEALAAALVLVASLAALLGYPTAMLTLTRGRTIGKLATGLRTVRDDAGPITFRHALTRSLIGIVEIYFFFGLPAVIASVVNPRGKRLGDMAAGTYVVRERHRANLPPPVPMPPHLAGWVTSADLATMPDGLALAIRTFLPAAFTMDPTVREQLGRELLEEALPYVSPAPPSGNHPEYVLAAIAADRRRRDLERLMRDARLRDRLIADDPLR
ncbi:MAG: RDD family protein [Actinomycetales bacterium]|nr:RDD family protein [Actinomycetales bacterium]